MIGYVSFSLAGLYMYIPHGGASLKKNTTPAEFYPPAPEQYLDPSKPNGANQNNTGVQKNVVISPYFIPYISDWLDFSGISKNHVEVIFTGNASNWPWLPECDLSRCSFRFKSAVFNVPHILDDLDVTNLKFNRAFETCVFNTPQDLRRWNIKHINTLKCVFSHCKFKQNLCIDWDTSHITSFQNVLLFSQYDGRIRWDYSSATNILHIFTDDSYARYCPDVVDAIIETTTRPIKCDSSYMWCNIKNYNRIYPHILQRLLVIYNTHNAFNNYHETYHSGVYEFLKKQNLSPDIPLEVQCALVTTMPTFITKQLGSKKLATLPDFMGAVLMAKVYSGHYYNSLDIWA